MKKSTLIKLHLYCGLFTAFYLIAFGFSSIVLNHKMDVENKAVKNRWSDQVVAEPSLTDKELAETVREGKAKWTDPVALHLPESIVEKDSPLFSTVTLESLATHLKLSRSEKRSYLELLMNQLGPQQVG